MAGNFDERKRPSNVPLYWNPAKSCGHGHPQIAGLFASHLPNALTATLSVLGETSTVSNCDRWGEIICHSAFEQVLNVNFSPGVARFYQPAIVQWIENKHVRMVNCVHRS
jgi:hypothetical protein